MSKQILRNEDFKTSSNPANIQGMYYRGEGFPVGRLQSPNAGALYLDNLSGQLWICSISNSTANDSWVPFFSDFKPNIAIDTDVMDGDFVGIFGVGAWATSTALPAVRSAAYMVGNASAVLVAGGYSTQFNPLTTSVIFNGSTWNSSGNMAFRLAEGARAGSINAALAAGGGNGSSSSSLSFLYDGSTWSTGSALSQTKEALCGHGTQSAAWCAGGANGGGNVSRSELFNGSAWSFNSILSATKAALSALGAQNAAAVVGGANTPYLNVTEIFNGSAWSIGPNINISRDYHAGSGTLMAGWIAAGQRSGSTKLTSSELFNGSTWIMTGDVSQAKDRNSNGAGSPSSAIMAGGVTSGSTVFTNRVELHNQNVYRKLNYTNARSAVNIGMAYGVSSTSLTASLLNGDIPSTYIPPQTMFGINKFNSSQTWVYTSTITGTVLSVSASTGTATLNLSTTMTGCFWPGAAILIKHASNATGTKFPIVGGTDIAPVVRWVNASSTSVSSFTFSCLYNGRFTSLTASGINIISQTAYIAFANIGNVSASLDTFKWIKVGDIINIPYSSSAGLTGSQYNYGTYLITYVQLGASNLQVGVVKRNTAAQSEFPAGGIGGISIYQQLNTDAVCLDQDALRLGVNNKMHVPMLPFNDDFQNGRI